MSEIADHDRPPAQVESSGRGSNSSYADIGDRVAGVLAAAEAAANQIQEDARGSAHEILSAAHDDADRLRREVTAYEADTRAAVDSYASDRRREAEQDVQTLLADGEAQARATRQAAEAMARQIEEAAKQRGAALREESRSVEERLKKALTGLRRMSTDLEDLLGAPVDDGESLVDALKPYAQRDAEQAELAATRSDEA
jgi:cell division septum initiation protein DivIVA